MVMCMTHRPHLKTVTEVVAELGLAGFPVSKATIYRWIRTGRIPATDLAGWRIHPAVVEALKTGSNPHDAVRLANDTENATA